MFTETEEPTTVDFPVVSGENESILEQFAPIKQQDYADFKRDFVAWLLRKGKRPFRGDGYAETTARETHYKIEVVFRWRWERDGYTKGLSPDHADAFIDALVSKSPMNDPEVYDYVKALKRFFKWRNDACGADIDWGYHRIEELTRTTDGKSIDYFKQREMADIYHASLDLDSVKSYHNKGMSPEERDRIKAHLAMRFEKPKSDIGPEDFDRANSWKFPSMLSVSIDCGLRPIEVGRGKISWLNLADSEIVIPKDESTKNDDPWECALSPRSVRALRRWVDERATYEKYDGRDELWLTKYGNPYGKDSLNPLLDRILENTGIEPHGRDLSWYSLRRGAATMWANNAGIEDAKEQMRHKNLETTLRYVHSESSKRADIAEGLW